MNAKKLHLPSDRYYPGLPYTRYACYALLSLAAMFAGAAVAAAVTILIANCACLDFGFSAHRDLEVMCDSTDMGFLMAFDSN